MPQSVDPFSPQNIPCNVHNFIIEEPLKIKDSFMEGYAVVLLDVLCKEVCHYLEGQRFHTRLTSVRTKILTSWTFFLLQHI